MPDLTGPLSTSQPLMPKNCRTRSKRCLPDDYRCERTDDGHISIIDPWHEGATIDQVAYGMTMRLKNMDEAGSISRPAPTVISWILEAACFNDAGADLMPTAGGCGRWRTSRPSAKGTSRNSSAPQWGWRRDRDQLTALSGRRRIFCRCSARRRSRHAGVHPRRRGAHRRLQYNLTRNLRHTRSLPCACFRRDLAGCPNENRLQPSRRYVLRGRGAIWT